ncbi:TPA_asm: UL3 uORF RNA *1 [Human alphaherpesvirus 1]
MNKDG